MSTPSSVRSGRVLLIALVIGASTVSLSGCFPLGIDSGRDDSVLPPISQDDVIPEPAPDDGGAEEPAPAPEEVEPNITLGQENALRSAESYLSFTHFSREGLIGQLEFEGFTTEEASWAVDQVGADWNEQAAGSAASYLELTSFSRTELYDQLIFEGFTPEQAEFGVTSVGY